MLRTMIRLPDGREIFSGPDQENVIQNVKLTECVNDSKELTLGSVCANMLEVDLQTPNGGLEITAEDEIAAYKVDDSGQLHLMGYFIATSPKRTSANTLRLTAYDRVSKLDKDLSQWLSELQGWPYTLYTFADMVCKACGLVLKNAQIPNGTYQVQHFTAQGVTGRKLMQWIGEAAGRFCRATPEGQLEFAWYTPSNVQLTPAGDRFYYQNSLSYETYAVAPIEKVHLKLTQNDVGVVWPDESGEKNTYVISGNYLLNSFSMEQQLPVVQTLYAQLKDVTYTPCSVRILGCVDIHAGQTLQITDRNGKSFLTYVMKKTQSGQTDTLVCTGSQMRDSTVAMNNEKYRASNQRRMELEKSEEGLSLSVLEYVENHTVLAPQITGQFSPVVRISNALQDSISNLHLYGKTTQDGIPTPEAPVELVSAGASGSVDISLTDLEQVRKITVSTPNRLPGIPVSGGGNYTDENGQQWICDEIDFNRGVYVQRTAKQIVENGAYVTTVSSDKGWLFRVSPLPNMVSGDVSFSTARILCNYFECRNTLWDEDGVGALANMAYAIIGMPGYSVDEVKAWIEQKNAEGNPLTFLYELAEPIETPLSNEEMAAFAALGNPKGNVTVYSEANLQVELSGMASAGSVENAQNTAENAQADADAANAQLRSIQESISELVVASDLIRASVQAVEGTIDGAFGDMEIIKSELASMELDSGALRVEIEKINNDGVKKVTTTTGTFDESGLAIDRTDSPTKTQVTPDGMTVYKKSYNAQTPVLSATSDGVDATNLHAKTYLIVGENSRFENYGSDRTGCFWIGG